VSWNDIAGVGKARALQLQLLRAAAATTGASFPQTVEQRTSGCGVNP
jgi:hypothetical protein